MRQKPDFGPLIEAVSVGDAKRDWSVALGPPLTEYWKSELESADHSVRPILHLAAGSQVVTWEGALIQTGGSRYGGDFVSYRFDAIVGLVASPTATEDVTVKVSYNFEAGEPWLLQVKAGREKLTPIYRGYTIIPTAPWMQVRCQVVGPPALALRCAKVCSCAAACECAQRSCTDAHGCADDNMPLAVFACLKSSTRIDLALNVDIYKPLETNYLPNLYMPSRHAELAVLHQELIEAVWHPRRVQAGLICLDE